LSEQRRMIVSDKTKCNGLEFDQPDQLDQSKQSSLNLRLIFFSD